jgi:hypothetical protein
MVFCKNISNAADVDASMMSPAEEIYFPATE